MAHSFSALMTGRYRPHLSLREGLEQPPRSGAEKPRFSNPFYSRAPFPLALDDPGSVLAVKGSLRRFAPWTAPGRSERRAAYEEKKGGVGPWGAEGELAHGGAPDRADNRSGSLLCRHGLHLLPTSESSLSAARGFTGCTRNTLGRWKREPDRIRFD